MIKEIETSDLPFYLDQAIRVLFANINRTKSLVESYEFDLARIKANELADWCARANALANEIADRETDLT